MTIAEQLKVKDFPFEIKDKNGNEIYFEDSNGVWVKSEYDSDGNKIRFENSNGVWIKSEYDTHGDRIYYENSNGIIIDSRPKTVEVTLEDIAKKLGIKVEQLRIKD